MDQEVVIAIISSGAFFTFVQYLITRHDTKKNKNDDRYEELRDRLEKREEEGKERFETHKESIEKLSEILELQKVETNGIKQLMVGIGHDKLVYMTDKIARRGSITLKEKATLDAIFNPYHSLGGNGDGEAGYKYVITLPVVTDEIAREKDNAITRHDIGISNK